MSWAEIKKAVNDDFSKPLSTRISEWFTSLKTYISTGGNVKVVRNVQRGTVGYSNYAGKTVTVTLSGFTNTSKMAVKITGSVLHSSGSYYYVPVECFVNSLTTTQLTIKNGANSVISSGQFYGTISYEVIEYY